MIAMGREGWRWPWRQLPGLYPKAHAMQARSPLPSPSLAASRRTAAPTALLVLAALSALLALLPMPCAAQLTPSAQREIAGLLQAVGTSGCHFLRGGTAHSASQAQEHLSKKYEYMAARDMLSSAEDFISKVAARSSTSGEAYAIRCAEAPAQKSEEWMKTRLKAMRQPATR